MFFLWIVWGNKKLTKFRRTKLPKFQQLQKVSEYYIWFSHFKLNVLEGDMVSFTGARPISAREGEAKFWITL